MQPDKPYPFAPGSLEEVVAHLALWGEVVSDGFARVEFQSDLLQQKAADQLRRLFAAQQVPFHTIELPRHQSAVKVADFLMQQFRQLPEGVVSLVWSAEVFPEKETLEDSLRVLNFRRDNLAQFPLKQIWWMPYDFANHVRQAIPDLNRWFFVQLELMPDAPRLAASTNLSMSHGSEKGTQGIFMVPTSRNPHFVGREQVFQALHDALHDRKNVLLTQAISGLGGIGKTQTACEYAYRHRDEYRAVLWATAENESSLSAGFREIARELNLPEQNAPDAEAIRDAVRLWLQENTGYLLILDNADSPESVRPFLPEHPAGHIVLTSRARQFAQLGNVSVVRLETLPEAEAQHYLLERIYPQGHSDAERDGAEALARELDGLPLALELAASYMVQQKRDIGSYLREFRERKTELLRTGKPLRGDYHETVLATWEPNFRAVEERSPAAGELLNLSAFLAPEAIPFALFLEGAEALGPALAAALNPDGEAALNLMETLLLPASYSLISVDLDSQSFAVHRLVQVAIRARLKEGAQRDCVERIIAALVGMWPGFDYIHWKQLDRLLPHQIACVEYSRDEKIETDAAARLYNQTALYLESRAEYARAEPLYNEALAIRRKILPEGHPNIALNLNNLAVLYQTQGRYAEAEPLFNEALAIRRKALPEGHPDIAQSLNNLAGLYQTQSRYAEAEPLFNEALAIVRKTLPEGHPNIALSLNNLAGLYQTQSRYAEAEPLFNEALAIRRKTLPEGHPDIAQSLNNLAGLYQTQGRYAEAELLLNEALAIRCKALPEGHPDIALSLNNLAGLYRTQGRYDEAEPLLNEALAIFERSLGPEHPNTKIIRENRKIFLRERQQNQRKFKLRKRK